MEVINFGPHLVKTSLDQKDFETIKQLSNETTFSMHNQLAGQIEFQKTFNYDIDNKILEILQPKFTEFLNSWQEKRHKPKLEYMFSLENVWLNRMKAGEYNPDHNHFGDISFVYYLDVPEEIHNEENKSSSMPNGAISFSYGKDVGGYPMGHFLDPVFDFVHVPKENELLMFPSYLYHSVQQFKSDVERVSLAGNAVFSIKEDI
jgi:hypothetical protein